MGQALLLLALLAAGRACQRCGKITNRKLQALAFGWHGHEGHGPTGLRRCLGGGSAVGSGWIGAAVPPASRVATALRALLCILRS